MIASEFSCELLEQALQFLFVLQFKQSIRAGQADEFPPKYRGPIRETSSG
jgi:hypothetical protein